MLVIGQTPSPSPSTIGVYGKEVVERRVRVYWPLDKSWYEGRVKSYDDESKKHLIQYDDSEEELLDLSNEKIEWVEPCVEKFKRLRRGSLGFRKIVLEDDEMENVEGDNGGAGGGSGGDDSSDEDWGKNAEKDVSEEEDVDLMDEEEADDGKKGKRGGKDSSIFIYAMITMEFLMALIMTDASERFSTREAEKFPFLRRKVLIATMWSICSSLHSYL
ncbi:hypothetical protein NC651_032282 [Populus alba x Populus x berolinensis]|nr:hypothetical protein NC651_032282 [Populus alba x Populus x berolinensis]